MRLKAVKINGGTANDRGNIDVYVLLSLFIDSAIFGNIIRVISSPRMNTAIFSCHFSVSFLHQLGNNVGNIVTSPAVYHG